MAGTELLVGEVFRRAAQVTPEGVAASLGGSLLRFGSLDRDSDRAAVALGRLGARQGDRVAWCGPTTLDAVGVFAALAKLGAVFVPLNPALSGEELEPLLRRARCRALVWSGPASAARDVAGAIGLESVEVSSLLGSEATAREGAPFSTIDPTPAPKETDPHVIFFTSGSTGRPKGVVLSHRANCLRTFPPNAPVPGGPTVCMFPLFHMAAWTIALGCWQLRQEIALVAEPSAQQLLDAVVARRARRIYLIPAVWDRVLVALGADPTRWDLSSLVEADTGTSATPPELLAALRRALPHTVTRVMYGSTEAGAAANLEAEDLARKPGSVGRPHPCTELRIAPDGEVLVRNPWLMDGYFEDPVATAEALVDGWYRTGDLGALDGEGYLSIVGRARDVIRTGGETVAPVEVEAVLGDLAGVAEVAVVGLADPRWGEVVCAVVVPAGPALTLEDLRAGCVGKLASFKQPRRLVLVDSLPRTAATGQVQRSLLVERLGLSRTLAEPNDSE